MKFCLSILAILSTQFSHCQLFEWAKSFGGSSGDKGYSITTDDQGNSYTCGIFGGTVDFDPGPGTANLSSNGNWDVFVLKLDPNGNFIWAHSIGGAEDDHARAISIDNSGNVIVTGSFKGTADFNPGVLTTNLTSSGLSDGFLLKLDGSGNFLWANSTGGTTYDGGQSLATDAADNIYVVGVFEGTVDFDPGAANLNYSSNGSYDVFIQSFNSAGALLWAKTFGGTGLDDGHSITIDSFGDLYITGNFEGTCDFDPNAGTSNSSSNGAYDCYLLKLSSTGDFMWNNSFGGAGTEQCFSVTIDNLNNPVVTGSFNGTVDFDPGVGTNNLTSNGSSDIFLSKYDSNGNALWALALGDVGFDIGQSVTIDNLNNIYVTGFYNGTVDFNPGVGVYNPTSNGGNDVFVLCLDSAGVFNWVKVYGGPGSDNGLCLSLDNTGNIYTTGEYQNSVDFDPDAGVVNMTSNGSNDIFVQKLGQCILNTSTILVDPVTIQATLNGAQYQWIDCGNGNSVMAGEINQTFVASSNGNYAVIISQGGCSDTSSCVTINQVGIEEMLVGPKQLIRIVDLMGRETVFKRNTTLIYLYSDGTTEKRYVLEK